MKRNTKTRSESKSVRAKNVYMAFEQFTDIWLPKIMEEFNEQRFTLIKFDIMESSWQADDNEDRLFFMLDGEMEIRFKDFSVVLKNGDVYVVPKQKEYQLIPKRLSYCILIESAGTRHTVLDNSAAQLPSTPISP